jgi:hypothetical protein
MTRHFRIGQIVPSSNTTMETEIPAMLTARQQIRPDERFTFHSSRMRMKKVVKEELAAMDAEPDRCAVELSDATACVRRLGAVGEQREVLGPRRAGISPLCHERRCALERCCVDRARDQHGSARAAPHGGRARESDERRRSAGRDACRLTLGADGGIPQRDSDLHRRLGAALDGGRARKGDERSRSASRCW